MKIKIMFASTQFPHHYIIKLPDGTFARFLVGRFRLITEKDLTPVKGVLKDENCKEVSNYLYKMYGFKKIL